MKIKRIIASSLCAALVLSAIPISGVVSAQANTTINVEQKELRLWYSEPAPDDDNREWRCQDSRNTAWETLALPIANSYLGAKVFGLTERERIQINENSLSTEGGSSNAGTTNFTETYIHFNHSYDGVSDYERDLVLNNAISNVSYKYNDVTYTREYFTSYPDKVMVIKLDASKTGALDFTLEPTIPYFEFEGKTGDVTVSDITEGSTNVATITLEGHLPGSNMGHDVANAGYGDGSGTIGYEMDFEAQFKVFADGGTMTSSYNANGGTVSDVDEYSNGKLTVTGADSAYIIIALGTNYELSPTVFNTSNNSQKLESFPHPHEKVTAMIDAASQKSIDELKQAHIEDYKSLFERATVDLGAEVPSIPTNEVMDNYRAGSYSQYVEELMFAYGRYMLISSSRDGNLPPNLNGIWNRYHAAVCKNGYWGNINIQMNYWSAFNTNLAECFDPYVDLYNAYIESNSKKAANQLVKMGAISSADEVDGYLWSMETGMTPFNTNATPGGRDGYGNTPYMAESFWDYYDYTRDEELLQNVVLPALISSANFLSYVMEYDEETGLYLAPNSGSPEQSTTAPFIEYVNNHPGYLPQGATYDQSLTYSNYVHILEALEVIDESTLSDSDRAVVERIREQIDKLDPIPIGLSGQIKEFREEEYYGDIGEPNHRHISHLTTLYPGSIINEVDSPAWLDAAEVSLDGRGDSFNWGWSHVAHILSRARTGDGNTAYHILSKEITSTVADNLCTLGGGNFQVEANLGTPSAISEMLLQSHQGYIEPLAALPDAWAEKGSFSGLITRGNFEVDAQWQDGIATTLNIKSRAGGTASVKYNGIAAATVTRLSDGSEVEYTLTGKDIISFDTELGESYVITGFVPVAQPDAPATLGFTSDSIGEYKLTVGNVDGVSGYNLYVAHNSDAKYTLVGSSKTGTFTYSAPDAYKNARTTFAATAVDSNGNESKRVLTYSNPADISATVNDVVGNLLTNNSLQITIASSGNAAAFKVYMSAELDGERTLVAESEYPIITVADYNKENFYYVSAVSSYDGEESEVVAVNRFGSKTVSDYNAANILSDKTFVADSRASTTHVGTINGEKVPFDYSKLTDKNKTDWNLGRFSTVSGDGDNQAMDATVDLEAGYILDTLTIWDFNANDTTANFVGNTFEIKVYSLGEWTTVYAYDTNAEVLAHRASGTKSLVFDLGGIRAEKINIYATDRVDTNSISIYEIECTGVIDTTEYVYSDNILLDKEFIPTAAANKEVHATGYGYETLTDDVISGSSGRFSTKTWSNTQVVDATIDLGGKYSLGEIKFYDFNGHTSSCNTSPEYMGTELLVQTYSNGTWSDAVTCAQANYGEYRQGNTSLNSYISFNLGGIEAEKIRIYIPTNYKLSDGTMRSISLYEIVCSGTKQSGGGYTQGDVYNIISDKEFVRGERATAANNANFDYNKLTDGDFHYNTGRFSTVTAHNPQVFDASVDFGGDYSINEFRIYDFKSYEEEACRTNPRFAGSDLLIEAYVDGVWVTVVDITQEEYNQYRVLGTSNSNTYLSFDFGGMVASAVRMYQSNSYLPGSYSISYYEIQVYGKQYVYAEGNSNRENIFANVSATTNKATENGYPVSNAFDGLSSSYTSVDANPYTITLTFDDIKVLNELSIYEILDDNLLDGQRTTASDGTKIEVFRDGVWLTVYDGISLSSTGRTVINMLGVDCSSMRITFNNTRLFDGESEYRSAKIGEISCTTATQPVDRTELLEAYKKLSSAVITDEIELGTSKKNALAEFMAYITATNATQVEVDAYTAEIDAFCDMLLAGNGETVDVKIGHSCSFQNNVSVNYYIPASDLEGYTGIHLVVTREKLVDGIATTQKQVIENYKVVGDNLKFTYDKIAACEMGDTISATIYAIKDSKLYESALDTYSVKTYAENRLNETNDEKFKVLLVDMLNYGAAAQIYFDYNADLLVNRDLTPEQAALATGSASPNSDAKVENELDNASAKIAGQSVVFNNNVELKYYLSLAQDVDLSSLNLVLKYTTVGGIEKIIEINGKDFVYSENNKMYTAKCTEIAAADMGCEISVTIYDGLTPISDTTVYSIETYVYNRLKKSNDEIFKALITEMYKYSESAKAYFTKS